MALQNTTSNGNWTNEKDIADAKAIIFKAVRYEEGVPNTKFGGTRNILEADLTIFDKAALDGGAPQIIKGALLTGAGTTRQYGDKIGQEFVAKLALKPSKRGKDFYAPVSVDDAVFEKVAAYVEQRDAKIAAALDGDEPDWADED